jgi:hypothetical protein
VKKRCNAAQQPFPCNAWERENEKTNQPSLTRISMRFPAFPKKEPPLFTNGDEEGQFFYLQVFIGIIANVLG